MAGKPSPMASIPSLAHHRQLFIPSFDHPERPICEPLSAGSNVLRVESSGQTKSTTLELGPDSPLISTATLE